MKKCDVCGNEYDKCFTLTLDDKSYTFDCFECAIFKCAPSCAHCDCKIIGHGVETKDEYYCCAHCAKQVEDTNVKDRDRS